MVPGINKGLGMMKKIMAAIYLTLVSLMAISAAFYNLIPAKEQLANKTGFLLAMKPLMFFAGAISTWLALTILFDKDDN